MTFIVWFAMLGAVLLLLALSSSYLRWIPVTSSVVSLPWVSGWVHRGWVFFNWT
ncbi:hypothetical protein PshuTeo1_26150 [Pseudomonas hunanensis]|nr:hypothetical protein PshuTeo1_26150 [Pseudomonas hunanensis]